MKTILLSILIIVFSTNNILAQTTTSVSEAGTQNALPSNVYGVGLTASWCSGIGIAFREHLAGVPIAYQVTIGPWKTSNFVFVSVGAEFQYDLSLSTSRLYAVLGGGYYYKADSASGGHYENPLRLGAGIGYEIPFTPSIGAYGNIMITAFLPSGNILPLPSLGVLVYFK